MAFSDAWAAARDVPGWLTQDQARVLHDAAAAVPAGGRVVEIGSHEGRSTIVLAAAAPPGALTAVDPFPEDWRYGAPGTEQRWRDHLAQEGLLDRVQLRVSTSSGVRRTWTEPVDLVYVDGKHDYWTVRDDLRWSEHLRPGGRLLLHDAFSSVGVTAGLLRTTLAPGASLRFLGRTGSLACLVPGPARLADRGRVLGSLPWFARNLVVKVALRLRARRLAALLRHHGPDDPF